MSGKGRKSGCGTDLPACAILASGLFSLCLKVTGKGKEREGGGRRASGLPEGIFCERELGGLF